MTVLLNCIAFQQNTHSHHSKAPTNVTFLSGLFVLCVSYLAVRILFWAPLLFLLSYFPAFVWPRIHFHSASASLPVVHLRALAFLHIFHNAQAGRHCHPGICVARSVLPKSHCPCCLVCAVQA